MTPVSHREPVDLKSVGEGRFDVAYQAKHKEFGTAVHKKPLGDRYAKYVLNSLS